LLAVDWKVFWVFKGAIEAAGVTIAVYINVQLIFSTAVMTEEWPTYP